MKFGKSWDEVENEPASSGAGGFIKYFKDGDTTFRIIQEPQDWVGYWEHYNPGGFPFPCTGDRKECPGCTSSNEKMKKAGRKIAINVLEGEYVNVYKFPKTLADKLANRANRNGTITDRDYTISKIKGKNADGSIKTDYDLEGQDKIPVDLSKLQMKDVEAMLAAAFNDAWGDSDKALQTERKAEEKAAEQSLKEKLAQAADPEPTWAAKDEPKENKVWSEEELRELPFAEILIVCSHEGMEVPEDLATSEDTNKVVDWLLDQ